MNERPTEWLEQDEVRRMLNAPDQRKRQGLRDRCVLQTLAETGIRKGELLGLRIGSLTTHNGGPVLRVRSLKKRHRDAIFRTIPVTDGLADLLRRYIEWEHGENSDPDMSLFSTLGKHGNYIRGPLTARAVDLIVKKYAQLAGIEKRITSHSLRHTNATLLLETGSDIETVRQILGHTSLSSTQRYVHSTEDRKREAINNLGFSDAL